MNAERLKQLLGEVQDGTLSAEDAFEKLRSLPYQDLSFARVDHHRTLRKGFPEAIFRQGKTASQVKVIVKEMLPHHTPTLATRATPEIAAAVQAVAPHAVYHSLARLVVIGGRSPVTARKRIWVLTGGTADLPVAEEASLVAEAMGFPVQRLYDVGVAGLHRLGEHIEALRDASVVVVVAGMEGALASVVGGFVACPVIAVPTSVGYGASFQGLAALLGMLNSCAPGVAVVNIDNGFGAGYLAATIVQQGEKEGYETT